MNYDSDKLLWLYERSLITKPQLTTGNAFRHDYQIVRSSIRTIDSRKEKTTALPMDAVIRSAAHRRINALRMYIVHQSFAYLVNVSVLDHDLTVAAKLANLEVDNLSVTLGQILDLVRRFYLQVDNEKISLTASPSSITTMSHRK